MSEQTPFNPAPYEKYRVDLTAELMDNPVLLTINGVVISTLANFSLWIGKAKSKKTFLLTSLTAAAACSHCSIETVKGVFRPDANKILYFDTEQSPFHVQRTIKRICKQIGISEPGNLTAYGLRPVSPKERLLFIESKAYNTPGLALVVIDGIADLLTKGINDEPEAIEILSKLMKWTEEKNIHIITVLHMNKADFNARGVIGTALQNKAESTIEINKDKKDSTISIVHALYCRDMDFKDFAFTISDDGVPILTDIPPPEKPALLQQKSIFELILPVPRIVTHGVLVAEYMERTKFKERATINHINKAVENKILDYDTATKGYKLFQFDDDEKPPF